MKNDGEVHFSAAALLPTCTAVPPLAIKSRQRIDTVDENVSQPVVTAPVLDTMAHNVRLSSSSLGTTRDPAFGHSSKNSDGRLRRMMETTTAPFRF